MTADIDYSTLEHLAKAIVLAAGAASFVWIVLQLGEGS